MQESFWTKNYILVRVVLLTTIFVLAARIFVKEFPQYVVVVSGHWVALMSGLASIGIMFWEKIRNTIPKYVLYSIALMCVFFAGFQAWQDSQRNLTTVVGQRATETSNLEMCRSDLKVQSTLNGAYSQQISSMQQTLNSSQSIADACVAGSIDKLKKLQPVFTSMKVVAPYTSKYANVRQILVLTSQPVQANLTFRCDNNVDDINFTLLNVPTIMDARWGRTSPHDFAIRISSPVMSPTAPLLITMFYDHPGEINCTFAQG